MKFYRYEAVEYASMGIDGEYETRGLLSIPNPKLELREYVMVDETPKGYWISSPSFKNDANHKLHRWVSKKSLRRFAYPTKKEALTNYIKRTERRIKILERQAMSCNFSLSDAKIKMKDLENESN